MSRNPIPEKAAVSSPSATAFLQSIIATAVLSLALGYWVGAGKSFLSFGSSKQPSNIRRSNSDDGASSSSEISSEDETNVTDHQFSGVSHEECKLVLVVRTDLGMGRGKAAAQCGHATLACYKSAIKHHPAVKAINFIFADFKFVKQWEAGGQAKVALQVRSEDELLMLQAAAMSLSLTAKVVHDAGRTQIAAGSATVLGIGPAPKSLVDQVTGALKLY